MINRLIVKSYKKSLAMTVTLCCFILLAAMLASSALLVTADLNGALSNLLHQSKVPSYVQLYAGNLNQKEIDTFSQANQYVKHQQTVKMLGISGEHLFLKSKQDSEVSSMIDNSFVTQNTSFDFLLDGKNKIAEVKDGEIGVPVYYQQRYHLNIGSEIQIQVGQEKRTFKISCFIRDAQMNPALITSKRFLISDHDWQLLARSDNRLEYLIEFKLYHEADIAKFSQDYANSQLPKTGTVLTRQLFQVLNALTDGIVIAITCLMCALILLITFLALRFAILTAIAEDYREIGIMKAIGISHQNIRKLSLAKYRFLALLACLAGYFASFGLSKQIVSSMSDYMGSPPQTIFSYLLPALGAFFIWLFIDLFCRLIFRRLKKISAYQALQIGQASGNQHTTKRWSLSQKRRFIQSDMLLIGIRTVLMQMRIYLLPTLIYAICFILMTTPFNLLQTLKSSDFISYMGAGKSDLRLDYHPINGDGQFTELEALKTYLKDQTVFKNVVFYQTSAYDLRNPTGEIITTKIETSDDFTAYPIHYISGKAPKDKNELALSVLNADEFQVSPGDKVTLLLDGQPKSLLVTGIYQDVTNGGKTAKGVLPAKVVLWYTANLMLKDKRDLSEVKQSLAKQFKQIKVTDTDDYIKQTLGG